MEQLKALLPTNIQAVVLSECVESNGHHDSYFHDTYLNVETGEVKTHETHSTAMPGFSPLPLCNVHIDKLAADATQIITRHLRSKAMSLLKEAHKVFPGAQVEVTKGRKYTKGTSFIVGEAYRFKTPKKGFIPYLRGHSESGEAIKIAAGNVQVISQDIPEGVVNRIVQAMIHDPHSAYKAII